MTLAEIIDMLEHRLVHLQSLRGSAVNIGDLAQLDRIDADIADTQATLNLLRPLQAP